jgi:transcriptional regulator with XRE-family HTH domain
MVIHAHLEESGGLAGTSRDPRRTLQLEVQGVTPSGDPAHVLIHNVSATGLLLETHTPLEAGQQLAIDLPQAGATQAVVVWQSGRLFGCQFEAPVTAAVLSAAQLRGAVEREVALSGNQPVVADDGLGKRVQRLRKELGMSQGRLAETLGVSKPTVWAWEQGKARPIDSRIEALAEALGVSSEDLLAGSENPVLRSLPPAANRSRGRSASRPTRSGSSSSCSAVAFHRQPERLTPNALQLRPIRRLGRQKAAPSAVTDQVQALISAKNSRGTTIPFARKRKIRNR